MGGAGIARPYGPGLTAPPASHAHHLRDQRAHTVTGAGTGMANPEVPTPGRFKGTLTASGYCRSSPYFAVLSPNLPTLSDRVGRAGEESSRTPSKGGRYGAKDAWQRS